MTTRKRRIRLVSVKQAKELSISVHGSKDNIISFVNTKNAGRLSSLQLHVFRWLRAIYSKSGSYDPYKFNNGELYENVTNDRLYGMASIEFPSLLRNGNIETGLWCLGCRRNRETKKSRSIEDKEALSLLVRRARSRSGFIEHLRDCSRAMDIYRKLEQDPTMPLNSREFLRWSQRQTPTVIMKSQPWSKPVFTDLV